VNYLLAKYNGETGIQKMLPFYEREIKKKKGTPSPKQVQKLAGKIPFEFKVQE
jgi:hypothetical protein